MKPYQRIELDGNVARNEEEVVFRRGFTKIYFLNSLEEIELLNLAFKLESKEADLLYGEEMQGIEDEGLVRRIYISNVPVPNQKIAIFAI